MEDWDTGIDWSGCPLVVMDPDGGGWPVVKGMERLPIEALVVNHADGESIEDVASMFECPEGIVRSIIDYAKASSGRSGRGR